MDRRTATTIIILITTALLIGGVVALSQQNDPQANIGKSSVTTTEEGSSDARNESQDSLATSYKAEEYTESGNYQSPGGSQKIKVRITLSSDGTIIDTNAEGDDKSSDSRFYQSSFIANYKNKVIGKKIDEVKLDRVGASSLTSDGFNNALEDIKNKAEA